MRLTHFFILLAAIIFTACGTSRVPFTQQLREKHQLTADELKSLQFYTSDTFVLRRGENTSSKNTGDGELIIKKDAVVEEVIIKAGTPCVIKEVVDGNRVTVSFGEGAGKTLVFGSLRNRDGFYTLNALEWTKGKGRINYGEHTYYSSPGSQDIFLTIKMKSLEQLKTEQKVVKGETVK